MVAGQTHPETTMKPRERVLRAWKRMPCLPDRVPIQFELWTSLLEHFGREFGGVVTVGAAEHTGVQSTLLADGSWLDEYGMRMRQGQIYVEVVEYPLAQVEMERHRPTAPAAARHR